MSDSIWNYRDDVDSNRSRRDETGDEQNEAFDSPGVPMPPAAAPTDAPLVDAADAPLADGGLGDAGAQGFEIIGYDVEATDGGLGKIDETSLEAGSAYVVVDTGWWIFGKKRLIPAGVIQSIDHDNGQVFVGLTKEEIKSAPDFAEEHREDRSSYDEYYGPYGR